MAAAAKAVSAPGKVLLAGGYLVLDRAHTGLVFGLDARIHVHVQPLPTSEGISLQEIVVGSPQFKYATWRYGYRTVPEKSGVQLTQLKSGPTEQQSNPFVETALSFALSYISNVVEPLNIQPASVTILADNDYYSSSKDLSSTALQPAFERFTQFHVPLWDAHKTGLGSSAALVTSFIGAMLTYYLPQGAFSLCAEADRHRLHNLAQAAHSAAQGKVGSGFDVASAVFGSCIYRRFTPSIIENLGEPGSAQFAARLTDVVEDHCKTGKWDEEIVKSKVSVPKSLRLVMCDVDCGSKTPGMVKQVLGWRKSNPEAANKLWAALQSENDRLAAELVHMTADPGAGYTRLKDCIHRIRRLVRQMSDASGVPIEPPAQTALLDACTQIQGVVGGVTPGAGGFDAVALLIEDSDEVVTQLESFLSRWQFGGVAGGDVEAGTVRLLGVREEMDGVKEESVELYRQWLAAEAAVI